MTPAITEGDKQVARRVMREHFGGCPTEAWLATCNRDERTRIIWECEDLPEFTAQDRRWFARVFRAAAGN